MASIKQKRAEELRKQSQAAGEATRQANVDRASQQERTALEKGGRFQRDGEIITVTKNEPRNERGGRDLSINFNERLGFSETTKESRQLKHKVEERVRISDDIETKQTTKQIEKAESRSFGEVGEASAPPIGKTFDRRSRGLISVKESKPENLSENLENLLGKNISVQRIFDDPNVKQSFDTLENFGRDILGSPELLGSPGPKTKEQAALISSIKEDRKETSLDLLAQGKIKEGLEKPGAKGSLLTAIAIAAAPVSPSVGGSIATGLSKQSRQLKLSDLESVLGLGKGAFQKLPEGSIGPTGKGIEKFISTGGTEKKPKSIFIVKLGKGDTVKQIDLIGPKLPVQSPKEAKIGGALGKVQQKELGAQKEFAFSDFRFKTGLTKDEAKITFKEGLREGQIKEFATARETKLENIIKGKPEKIQEDFRKPPSVFAQTKAEKASGEIVLEEKFPSIGEPKSKPITPFSKTDELGGLGKTKSQVLTKEQEKIIRDFESPKQSLVEKKQPLENLFSAPVNFQQTQQKEKAVISETIPLIKPPKAKEKTGLKTSVIPGTTGKQNLISDPTGESFKITEDLNIKLGSLEGPKTDLKITDKLDIKKITDTKQDFLKPPPPTTVTPKVPAIPEDPVKPPVGIIPFAPLSSRDFDTPSGRKGRKKGFFGNVPQDDIRGIVARAPEITVSEGRGFTIKGLLGKGKPKSKKKETTTIDILGKSKSVNILGGKSKGSNLSGLIGGKGSKTNLGILGNSKGPKSLFGKSKSLIKL